MALTTRATCAEGNQDGTRNHNPRKSRDAAGKSTKGKGTGKGDPSKRNYLQPGSIATAFQDGKRLCPDFKRGECKVKGVVCNKGLHKCAKVGSKGRVCGMSYHGAHQCRAK